MEVDRIISHIFGRQFLLSEEGFLDKATTSTENNIKSSSLENLGANITSALERIGQQACPASGQPSAAGRIGSPKVKFDVASHVGTFIIGTDRLSLNSQSNFSSIRANICVCQGKWQYELQLGSKGVMQVGWATIDCKFSQEKGVGDTPDSYAYDGNRLRKWNISTYKYGEAWLSGDVVSCTIDLDEGLIEFFRNGRSMGVAFDSVKRGLGIAYFPAVSLAYTENLVANFGSTPFKYPIRGFRPLQDPPDNEIAKAALLCQWLERYLPLYSGCRQMNSAAATGATFSTITRLSPRSLLLAISAQIFHHLGPLVSSPYITEACLVPLIQQFCETDLVVGPQPGLMALLDLLWSFLEEFELKRCLESVVICLLAAYRHAPFDLDFPHQKKSLACLLAILEHVQTRKHLLRYILFDKIRFPSFVHVKPLDERGLAMTIPKVWWECKRYYISEDDRITYQKSCQQIKEAVAEIEQLQVQLLRMLLINSDGTDQEPSSRSIFLKKFRLFLGGSSRTASVLQTPLPVTLCCFHRLLATFWTLWEEELGGSSSSQIMTIPCRVFCDGSISYHNIDRLGGVLSHLHKALREDVIRALGAPVEEVATESSVPSRTARLMGLSSTSGTNLVFSVMADMQQLLDTAVSDTERSLTSVQNDSSDTSLKDCEEMDSQRSLTELLDGIILLYHCAAHKQLAKVSTLRENMGEYINALDDTEAKISSTSEEEVLIELQHARQVFKEKLCEQSRHMAWVLGVVYSPEKQRQVIWLLRSVLGTMKEASREGSLFSFVPDFYLEALIEACNALRTYFHPVTPIEGVPGHEELLTEVGTFLATHFADSRVVHAESKDSLIQALSSFVCHSLTLQSLERMPLESQLTMVKALLRPYENRPWAQSNWILVRLWQGQGFGFRYTKSPHVGRQMAPKPVQTDTTSFTQSLEPCPSAQFQKLIGEVLLEDEKLSTSFLNSLLNQLNWAFSEFIGMLQEIQNASNRPERIFIESRQLKICATCFDLALALLRVLEMVVSVARPIFCDGDRASSELLLGRLCQLLCQILNRVSSRSGCFDHVIALDIPGLETVDHYPVLTAVVGILVALIEPEILQSDEEESVIPPATRSLLSEPSFQMSSLHFLLGTPPQGAAALVPQHKSFSLHNYPSDVSLEEVEQLEAAIHHLDKFQKLMSRMKLSLSEDDLCTICYAYPISAEFRPCRHHSCRSCIAHHLMNHLDCFFCKAHITKVVDPLNEEVVLHDLSERLQQQQQQQFSQMTQHPPARQ